MMINPISWITLWGSAWGQALYGFGGGWLHKASDASPMPASPTFPDRLSPLS
jgi:hypothetical protein